MAVIDQVAQAVNEAAANEADGNLMKFARKIGVNYDALYALATGRRTRTVDAEMLQKLSQAIPQVGALFAPNASQVCNVELADSQV